VLPVSSYLVKTGGRLNVAAALQNRTVCNIGISSTSLSARFRGGYLTIGVTAPANCDYDVKSEPRWIIIEGPDVRSGSSQVTFRVTPS
ncbi:hypothetical protein OFP26_34720, partial [Escherichia coli]|nr:hypothetical protein [Escherichia coli]